MTIIATHVAVSVVFTIAGVTLLVIAARLVYGLAAPEAPVNVALAILLSVLAFAALGFTLAGIVPSTRTA